MKKYLLSLWLIAVPFSGYAATFNLPTNGDNVVGKIQWTRSLLGDTFTSLGRRYDVGYYQLIEANPGIDPKLPKVGTIVVIPTRYVMPDVPHQDIVVNLPELRVYYFPPNTHKVITFPVGIGREGWDTPLGLTTIIAKVKDPTWVPPKSIKDWQISLGYTLPKSVPPGPNNPLGSYALYLGFPGYRMHGTNDPSGIGRRSSSGCIRMWPEDIEELFALSRTGEKILVINEPRKVGLLDQHLYLESHTPLQSKQPDDIDNLTPLKVTVGVFTALHPATVNWTTAQRVAEQQNGIAQVIGKTLSAHE